MNDRIKRWGLLSARRKQERLDGMEAQEMARWVDEVEAAGGSIPNKGDCFREMVAELPKACKLSLSEKLGSHEPVALMGDYGRLTDGERDALEYVMDDWGWCDWWELLRKAAECYN